MCTWEYDIFSTLSITFETRVDGANYDERRDDGGVYETKR